MTLTTHALVGAAAASLFPQNPALAFGAGFLSHFAIDALPHWDYSHYMQSWEQDAEHPLNSRFTMDARFFKELPIFMGDALFGLVASVGLFCVWFFNAPPFIIAVGACAGLLPDALGAVYLATHWPLLRPLQRFHIWVQEGRQLESAGPLVGLTLQAFMVVLIVAALRTFS